MAGNFIRILRIIGILYRRGGLFLLSDFKILPRFIVLPLSIFSIHTRSLSSGKRVKLILQDLGPFFIKFGQTLATREDLIGPHIASELSELHDRLTPKFTKNSVKGIIKKELGQNIDDLFSSFSEKPIAAASIAEVFMAEDFSKNKVAVKILKPGIRQEFEKDLKLFHTIARFMDKYFVSCKRLKLVEVVESFAHGIKIEMDFTLEAAAASELKQNHKDDAGIYIPEIYWDLTSPNILTIEWVEGVPINRVSEIKRRKINIEKVANNFTNMFLNQAYRDGFFHADLHPGNVLVRDNADIVLIDFGIMGRLDSKNRMYLAEILRGFVTKDYHHIAQIHFDAGFVSDDQSMEEFAQACRAIGEPIVGKPTNKISIGRLLSQLFNLTRNFNMQTQTKLLLVQKTTVVVEGVISKLNPETNMWQLAEPWVKKWSEQSMGFDAKLLNGLKDVISFVKNDVVKFIKNRNKEYQE